MRRIHIGVMCLLMVLILGLSLEVFGQDKDAEQQKAENMNVPLGVIVLKPDESVDPKKSAVEFDHPKHFSYDCRTCHHKWEGKSPIPTCTTTECHDLLESPKKPTKYLVYTETGIKYYKYAFHRKCVGCHKEVKAKRKAMEMSYQVLKEKLPSSGPTGCIECHPKE